MNNEDSIQLPSKPQLPDLVRQGISAGQMDAQSVKEMLTIQLAWEQSQAAKEYQEAFAQLDIPPISKTGKGLNASYPPWHEIQRVIKPILKQHGFALSFTSGPPDDKDRIPIYCKLVHRSGHFESGEIWQPIGSVSRGMNANQAIASATSYGKRYCAANLLNLEFVDMDDDAQTFSLITEPQRAKIENLIAECKLTPFARARFLTVLGVKAVGDIPGDSFTEAVDLLERKKKQIAAAAEQTP